MPLSEYQRKKSIDTLLYEIGKDAYYHHFSVSDFAQTQGLSVQSVYRYLEKLEAESKVKKTKTGKKNVYSLVESFHHYAYPLANLSEDAVWNKAIKPLMQDFSEIASGSAYYAFSEMLNNAIDHSEGTKVDVFVRVNAFRISFQILDDGIGIFAKIASALQLEEKRFAILELAKGKFTTDPASHSGEGIFFSAKAADVFWILSDNLAFTSQSFLDDGNEWIRDFATLDRGTMVHIEIFRNHATPLSEIFDQYAQDPDQYGFTRTVVPVKLLEYGDTNPTFISRSQAKRLLVRFERFERIELDFSGIDEIGQGFADEVFRVFQNQHPNSRISAFNCSQRVKKMISRVTSQKTP